MQGLLVNLDTKAVVILSGNRKRRTLHVCKNWLHVAENKTDSWWLAWHNWLVKQSHLAQIKPPKLDKQLPDAPGTYVLQK